MPSRLFAIALVLVCALAAATTVAPAAADDDLPAGVMRGPLLHEHSFQAPLVNDWWQEGVPHYMIGASSVANEKFLRLTTNSLDDSGFAFNTAPMDHDNWEARVVLSIRPPPPALQASSDPSVRYQGGDGFALWYLDQPIGDDHQHVLKYSKSITQAQELELLDGDNPWRIVDQLLANDDTTDDIYEGIPDADLPAAEREAHAKLRQRREQQRIKKEQLFRRLFKRGTSIDDTDHEPRVMGVKFSDFTKGFAIVLDSVGGDEAGHLEERRAKGGAVEHHHHKPTISLLLNLPNHTGTSGAAVVNNYNPSKGSFRQMGKVLQCEYDFRQAASKPYAAAAAGGEDDREARALAAPEEPLELIVRYYGNKLTIVVRREDAAKRVILRATNDQVAGHDQQVEVQRTYRETLCGEVYPVVIPIKFHFGLSASTGRRRAKERRANEDIFQRKVTNTVMHVDVHDVHRFELRELGTDPKSMGYSKSIPIEHFNYDQDKRDREHFSRQIPINPDGDV